MLAVALLALALYVPGTLYPPSDLSHAVFRVAVCLGIAAGVGVPRGSLVRWGLVFWGFGIACSVLAAPDPWRALWSTHNRNEGAWQAAHYLGLLLVAVATPRERLARWVAIAAAAACLPGLLPLGWVNGRLAGSTGNPLYLAPLLLVGVWGAWKAGWRALAAALALAALATGSKGVVVAAIAAAGILVSRRWPIATLACGVSIAAGIWVVPMPASGLIRVELGRVALHGIAHMPLGWGAEGFPFVWDRYWLGASATGEAWHDRAHSLILDRAIEWGVVGVAGWLAVVAAAWRRAALPERMAMAAWLAYHLTMFEMMWGAAAGVVLLGYVLQGPLVVWAKWTRTGRATAAVALAVGALALAQSRAAALAPDFPQMQAAIEMWSPVGGEIVELYLRPQQSRATLDWADEHIETRSPHATQQWFLMAAWDRATYCPDLRVTAPWRPDVHELCPLTGDVHEPRF